MWYLDNKPCRRMILWHQLLKCASEDPNRCFYNSLLKIHQSRTTYVVTENKCLHKNNTSGLSIFLYIDKSIKILIKYSWCSVCLEHSMFRFIWLKKLIFCLKHSMFRHKPSYTYTYIHSLVIICRVNHNISKKKKKKKTKIKKFENFKQ